MALDHALLKGHRWTGCIAKVHHEVGDGRLGHLPLLRAHVAETERRMQLPLPVRNHSPNTQIRTPSRGYQSSSQNGLGVGCKLAPAAKSFVG